MQYFQVSRFTWESLIYRFFDTFLTAVRAANIFCNTAWCVASRNASNKIKSFDTSVLQSNQSIKKVRCRVPAA